MGKIKGSDMKWLKDRELMIRNKPKSNRPRIGIGILMIGIFIAALGTGYGFGFIVTTYQRLERLESGKVYQYREVPSRRKMGLLET